MANLWRTQRPRFPHYVSDGSGRDYYIKFNNAGYWENQFQISKKLEYEIPKYNNYHSLFHQVAPVKFIPSGNGRETYIINDGGFYHDQRPLASYKLNEFLRENKSLDSSQKYDKTKQYMSIREKKYNNKLQSLEKQLINRLYKIPMRYSKSNKNLDDENILPNIDTRKDDGKNEDNNYNNNNNILNGEERLNTLASVPSFNNNKLRLNYFSMDKHKKINKISLKNNFETIMKQSRNLERYELNNHSRRSDNENDYYVYKKGRIGYRLKSLKSLIENSSEKPKNTLYRVNTEENYSRNKNLSLKKCEKSFTNNKLTFSIDSSSNDKRFNTLE